MAKKMSPDQLAALGQELGALSRTNLPLDRGLAALAQEMGGDKIGRLCENVARDLGAGLPLDQALAKHDPNMPSYLVALVKAGLATGKLPQCLDRLATHARMVHSMRQTFWQTAFYPLVVVVFALGLNAFLIGFVLPRFAEIYRGFGMQLPMITASLLGLAEVGWTSWLALALGMVGIPCLLWLVLGKVGRAKFARKIPVVGGMFREASLGTWYDLVAMLLQSGTNLPQAVQLASNASDDPLVAQAGLQMAADLADGGAFGDSLRKYRLGSAWGAWLAEVGQGNGVLPENLMELSATCMAQAENRGRWLSMVLPPLVLVILSVVVVGGVIMVLFLPMFRLLEGLSG